jgi:hypothetical protein
MPVAPALAVPAGPLAVQALACLTERVCAHGVRHQGSDPDPEGRDHVRLTGSKGDAVTLTLTLNGGEFIRTLRQPGAGGPLRTNTGRCPSH